MKYVAAIDVGGTKILGALVSEDGQVIKELRIPSNFEEGGLKIMSNIFSLIDELKLIHEIDGVGIGIGGRIDTEKGIINWAVKDFPNYIGMHVKEMIEERYHVPCAVENDVKVAGYGEQWMGAGKNAKSYVCITLGTGVGGAVNFNGEMMHGAHWSNGELGHIILHPNGRQCTCGFKGCVEQYLSGHALVKIYNERVTDKVETGYQFFEHVKNNEEVALQVIDEFVDDLYTLLLTMFNGFDAERVIIGGGLIDTKEYWWDKLMKKIEDSPINMAYKPDVVPATLGNKAGYYGSAYIALKQL